MKRPPHTFPCSLTAHEIISYMETLRNEAQRQVLLRFFKTGKGDYGEGDEFLGIKVPQTREVVRLSKDLPLEEIPGLLTHRYHEIRLCGFLILVSHFERLATNRLAWDEVAISKRDHIVDLYLRYAEYANNWDLVDLSAPKILGRWLTLPTHLGEKSGIVDRLALSDNLWKQRISMVCTWKTMQMGDGEWCLRYAKMHLHHPHDLMQKAVGWMLRELGKRVDMNLLRQFLNEHADTMPRTSLRYAIEKMSDVERREWMERGRETNKKR